MALYRLDTDICSYVIRNRPEAVRKRMNAVPLESQAISVVTYAELMLGLKNWEVQMLQLRPSRVAG